jgi:neutral amino acid transport system permease protein
MTATEIFGIKVAFDCLLVIGLAIIVIIALHFVITKN